MFDEYENKYLRIYFQQNVFKLKLWCDLSYRLVNFGLKTLA